MSRIRVEVWRTLWHITGPSAVRVGLCFGPTPPEGPRVERLLRPSADSAAIKFDLEKHVQEILEGVADANEQFGGDLTVEAIQVTPDDYPSAGQAKFVAFAIARHAITGEGYPSLSA